MYKENCRDRKLIVCSSHADSEPEMVTKIRLEKR